MLKRLFIALFAVTLAGPAMAAGGDVELQSATGAFLARSVLLTKPPCSVDFRPIVKSVLAVMA